MICPFCSIGYRNEVSERYQLKSDALGYWEMELRICPECNNMNLTLILRTQIKDGGSSPLYDRKQILVYPRSSPRPPCHPDVPTDFAEDYNEACLILDLSPRASAALSRRCLQHVLEAKGKVKQDTLFNEITEILKSGSLPSYISDSIDAIRAIGNFSAHPIFNKITGIIVAVEAGEAEWTLDILEDLFDFYFVGPTKTAKKKSALNKKLSDAGKPPLK
jgi:hypothetical protein